MANLSNIDNKFLVTTGGNVLIGQTAATLGHVLLNVTGYSYFLGNITATGNVGIGVNTFGEKLEIAGNIRIHNNTNAPYIDFTESGDTTDSKARITMDQIDGTNGTLIFSTEGSGTLTERMRIDSSGNVGIGVTPIRKFDVNGTSTFYDNVYITSSKQIQWEGGNYWTWRVSGTEFQMYRGDTAATPFTVNTSGGVTVSNGGVFLNKSDGIYIALQHNTATKGYLGIANQVIIGGSTGDIALAANAELVFGSGGTTERMRLLNSYDTNLGSTQPPASRYGGFASHWIGGHAWIGGNAAGGTSKNLVLSQNAHLDSSATWVATNTDSANYLELWGGNFNFQVAGSTTAGTTPAWIQSIYMKNDGNVGIGTTSPNQEGFGVANRALSVKAPTSGGVANLELIGLGNADNDELGYVNFMSQAATDAAAAIVGLRHTSDTSGKLSFRTAGSERMRIDSNGNVGIGVTSPSYKLSVSTTLSSGSHLNADFGDQNSPTAAFVGQGGNVYDSGGIYRSTTILSPSTGPITTLFLSTYSTGHWQGQPTFQLIMNGTYYRGGYIKYWCQGIPASSIKDLMDGPYGTMTDGLSVTTTNLCASCHSGQPIDRQDWSFTTYGSYIRVSPIIITNKVGRRYFNNSSISALNTLQSSASAIGPAYFFYGISDTEAAGSSDVYTIT